MPLLNGIGKLLPEDNRSTITSVAKVFPAVSNTSYGNRHTAMYFSGPNENGTINAPAHYFESSGGDVTGKALDMKHTGSNARNVYGSGAMTIPGYDKDVFAYVHSNVMDTEGEEITLTLIGADRNETGSINLTDSLLSFPAYVISGGLLKDMAFAVGDLDGDGCKNEIVLVRNTLANVYYSVFRITYSNGKFSHETLADTSIQSNSIHYNTLDPTKSACPRVITGDFDGDGKEEFAFAGRIYDSDNNNMIRFYIWKYNNASGTYESKQTDIDGTNWAGVNIARADFDGDGQDEIAVLKFFRVNGNNVALNYPSLERWYCDKGSIEPKRDTSHIVGETSNALFGETFAGHFERNFNYFCETYSISAGPLTGTKGKLKTVDDVVISKSDYVIHYSHVWVIPTEVDTDGAFAGFKNSKEIYYSLPPLSDTARSECRASVITADFAGEGASVLGNVVLGEPVHSVTGQDLSYVAVLQALPYHIDNVNTNGTLDPGPTNYSFSGFNGDEGNGDMSVKYVLSASDSESKKISFNMASVNETVSIFSTLGSTAAKGMNIAKSLTKALGSFSAQANNASAASLSDVIQTVKESYNKSAFSSALNQSITAYNHDAVLLYSAPQHTWRYPVLNGDLPDGAVMTQEETASQTPDKEERYLTFTMYDTPKQITGDSVKINSYQPLHEEGNLFSYPVNLAQSEGYNEEGELIDLPGEIIWSKNASVFDLFFTKANGFMEKYGVKVTRSELTKVVSAIFSFFGGTNPAENNLPAVHSQTFSKKYSNTESIKVGFQGRSTLHADNDAGYTMSFVPYAAKEGTLKFAVAVTDLDQQTRLWDSSTSLYWKLSDPSLYLPQKFNRNGASFAINTNNRTAMMLRGMRFTVPSTGLDSDNRLVYGLPYKISVPVYNASFLDTDEFTVRLSYVKNNVPTAAKTLITEKKISLKGWINTEDRNKGWVDFDWTPDIASGNYYFYVEIDPENQLEEVHESRLDENNNLRDCGGNNTGFYPFSVFNVETDNIHSANLLKASGIKAAADAEIPEGKILVTMKFMGSDNIDVLEAYLDSQTEKDLPVPVTCEVMYEGDYIFPYITVTGYNYKEGTRDKYGDDYSNVTNEDIGETILHYSTSLFPGVPHEFTFMLAPSDIDKVNGVNFVLEIPSVEVETSHTFGESGESGESTRIGGPGSSGGGCDLGFSGLIMLGLSVLALKLRRR